MKTASLPSLRVAPELREAAESVLQAGETLSGFIEASVRETIERRRTGVYFCASTVHAELGQMLAKAAKTVRG